MEAACVMNQELRSGIRSLQPQRSRAGESPRGRTHGPLATLSEATRMAKAGNTWYRRIGEPWHSVMADPCGAACGTALLAATGFR